MFTIVISKYLAYKCIQKFLVFEDVKEGIEHFNILSQDYLDYAKDKNAGLYSKKILWFLSIIKDMILSIG